MSGNNNNTMPSRVRAAKELAAAYSKALVVEEDMKPGDVSIRPYIRGEAWPSPIDATAVLTAQVYLGKDEDAIFYMNEAEADALEKKKVITVPGAIQKIVLERGLTLRAYKRRSK